MSLRHFKMWLSLLWLPLLLTNCQILGLRRDPPFRVIDPFSSENSGLKVSEASIYLPNAYYPSVRHLEASSGKGVIDVTLKGWVRSTQGFIAGVQVRRLGKDILLIPIAHFAVTEVTGSASTPYLKTVRIAGLEKGHYTVWVMGRLEGDEEKRILTQTVKVSESAKTYPPFVERIGVSLGEGLIDVTIYGKVRHPKHFIADVQVSSLGRDIVVVPIAQMLTSGEGKDLMTAFEKTVRIQDLDRKSSVYTISVIGLDDETGAKSVISEDVEMNWIR